MRVRFLAAPTLALLWVAGCQKAPPAFLSGEFTIGSRGKAFPLASLAEEHKSDLKPTELSLRASGRYRADVARSILMLEGVELFQSTSGTEQRLFATPQSWTIRLTPSGFESDQALSPEKRWVSRAVASYWAGAVPSSGERTVTELDGENRVAFAAKDSRTVRRWLSKKAEAPDLMPMPNREPIPVESEVSGELAYSSPDGFPATIEGSKRTASRVGSRAVGESETQIRFRQSRLETFPASFAAVQTYAMAEPSQAAHNEAELQKRYLGTATLAQLMERAAASSDSKKRNEVFLALRALFYLKPENCAQAVRAAKGDPQIDLVAEALAGAGHAQAQAAFLEILRRSQGAAFRNRISLMVPLNRLEPESERILAELAFGEALPLGERYVAQLVVGSNVRRCLNTNPEQAKRLSEGLARALTTASTDDDRLNLLYAIGNAGHPALREMQLAYLSSHSPILRRAGAHSLRHLLDRETRAVLRARAEGETDPEVRRKFEEVLALP